jgi:hypothetical protein
MWDSLESVFYKKEKKYKTKTFSCVRNEKNKLKQFFLLLRNYVNAFLCTESKTEPKVSDELVKDPQDPPSNSLPIFFAIT